MDAAPLDTLEVLAIDCQATGATPRHGHVLEIAWCRLSARQLPPEVPVTHRLVRLPAGAGIPARVMQVTGIREEDLASAWRPGDVWREVTAALPPDLPAPAMAHFAIFEQRFLQHWHASLGSGPFPLELLCTHLLARRLFPGLPRLGLHALAGHLGLLLPEERRSADHARATALVWRALVPRLAERGVTTLGELRAFLATEAPRRGGRHAFPVQRQARLRAPDAPGVYRLRAPGGELLYVGKAASLRRRVNSYFQKRWRGDARMGELLTMAATVEWTVTETALEAALLESDQIKELAPRFNRALRARSGEVWFATPDLAEVAPARDARHPVGPLPAAASVCSIPALRLALARGVQAGEQALGLALGLSPRAALPDAGPLAGGLEMVRSRRELSRRPSLADLLRIGTALWAEAQEEEDEEREEETDWSTYWEDPGNVADAFEDQLRRATHLVRRARWLGQLRDSVVWWRAGARLRWLRLQAGRVESRGDARDAGALPAPVRDAREVDAAAYDRLRILTTELRAVVRQGAEAAVDVAGGRVVEAARLARRLAWL
jgi:DNA polymerase-3 subunit epsilon